MRGIPTSPGINWAVLVILIAPVFYLVRRMGVPMREFGLTSRNLWGSLLEGVGTCPELAWERCGPTGALPAASPLVFPSIPGS